MLNGLPSEELFYYPRDLGLNERISLLSARGKRVAYLYEKVDNSTFRYRVYNMVQVLNKYSKEVSSTYFILSESSYLNYCLPEINILIICRVRYSDLINGIIARAKACGTVVIFDVDDLVFDTRYVQAILNSLDYDMASPNIWDFWFAYVGRMGATMQLCDKVIVTNDFLAAKVRDFCNKSVSVIPNFLNSEQCAVSDQIYQAKVRTGFQRDSIIHIGYFSGTPTHTRDFEIVESALCEVPAERKDVHLRIAGYLHPTGELKNCCMNQIEIYPFRDFVNLQRLIGSAEFNIIPLQDSIFSNCKSELKYFEAGITGTVSIASPVQVFKKIIHHGENGYLSNPYEWVDRIFEAVDSLDSYEEMADNSRSYASDQCSCEGMLPVLMEAIRFESGAGKNQIHEYQL